MKSRLADMTPIVDLTQAKGTGPVRIQRPIYRDLLPPCNNACPAGENIQAWLALPRRANTAKRGRHWCGTIRCRPCMAACATTPAKGRVIAESSTQPVSIHAVERFLGDLAAREGWPFKMAPPSGKRVLVVGAGPSGLSAGYHLARLGHAVEIHEAGPLPGGMMHFGIPAYRLPRAELMREIARIEAMGVHIVLNHKVEDLLAEKAAGSFDASSLRSAPAPASMWIFRRATPCAC